MCSFMKPSKDPCEKTRHVDWPIHFKLIWNSRENLRARLRLSRYALNRNMLTCPEFDAAVWKRWNRLAVSVETVGLNETWGGNVLHLLEEFLVLLVSFLVHTHQPVKFIHYFGFHLITVTEKTKRNAFMRGHNNDNAAFILRAPFPNKFRISRILPVLHNNVYVN